MSLNILYQDEHIVAVDKPAGLLVHRSMIDRSETRFAMQMVRDQIGQHVYTVHRLDKPTSGVLLFALSSDIARVLGEQFASNQVHKGYTAIVRGYIHEQGVIDYPLKEELDKIADKMADQDKEAQSAISHYEPVATFELPYPVGRYQTARYSLLKLYPQTGRKHQLRRHMAHIRHPILGDTTHGDGKHNVFVREQFGFYGLALNANRMSLRHPVTNQLLEIETSIDDRILTLLSQWDYPKQEIRKIWSK
ncbi:tRNA pseudouridine(65) synthase TruC [Paraneptunicella aestuarii]|uniref:tRNA pseudouridine(65) synthase TruC n=1 Tax=Paraneptunicella aestuarii TaxID=2831148 RepID=UPI001E619C37|nr:tRNA pseudouridine(65) synthase TruC [Paraneptunicella aestuarii]UAA39700.1 tRNA pseudouridine(65) synthase TruC [Paraneptunicella aestuarii]